MTKYSPKAQKLVKEALHKYKKGTLKSGSSRKVVKNPQQAIAIGLSEARAEGAKVPQPKKSPVPNSENDRHEQLISTLNKKKARQARGHYYGKKWYPYGS
jgi:Family of unknown function (DUF6496)